VYVFPEWNVEDNRPEEAYLQAVARGIHRAGKDRKHLHTQSVCTTSIRPWRIIEILYHSNSSTRRRRNKVLGGGEWHTRYTERFVRQSRSQKTNLGRHVSMGKRSRSEIL